MHFMNSFAAARKLVVSAISDCVHESRRSSPTEIEMRDALLEALQHPQYTSQGWYDPPPHGVILVIGNPPNFERVNAETFRSSTTFARSDVHLTPESLVYVYASPVNVATGAIGDVACSIYLGSKSALRNHARRVWDVTNAICNMVELGMKLSDVHSLAMQQIANAGLANNVASIHDTSGTNIGHTLPWSDEPISNEERTILRTADFKDLVSNKRKFVNATEETIVTNNLAFTIEPRLNAPGLPMVNFHTVMSFVDGERVVLNDFGDLLTFEPDQ